MTMLLYNTLTRQKEELRPIHPKWVGLYTCGPTVYHYAHIGNLRTYLFEDVLRRTLEYVGYTVKHVMNITDVGHLTSDADTGEDKLEKGANREGKTVWDVAQFYTNAFLKDIELLNIKRAETLAPATEYISQQIDLIKKLFETGHAYETTQAVYFDVSTFPEYTKLSRQKLSEKKTGVRDEVVEDPEKKHPADFALWFKRVGKFADHIMRWPSPWGDGFPGWHIECSAISSALLGQPFDIHTGGVDHIGVHHTNEIAQSEAAYGKPLATIWMHGEFLLTDEEKMAKSGENFLTLQTLIHKGVDPISYRYFILMAHYRTKLTFSWEALQAAQSGLDKLRDFVRKLQKVPAGMAGESTELNETRKRFTDAMSDDLNTPEALSVVWELVHTYHQRPSAFLANKILNLLYEFDDVLGLRLRDLCEEPIPREIAELAEKREAHRKEKNWNQADEIRKKIEDAGYELDDTNAGPFIRKK